MNPSRLLLPVYYYHDHFMEMLTFVQEVYGSILNAEERQFIASLEALDKGARCLFIRMVNRKTHMFNPELFRYSEIEDVPKSLQRLIDAGFARFLNEGDYAPMLSGLGKADLLTMAPAAKKGWSKPRIAQHLLDTLAFAEAVEAQNALHWVTPCHRRHVQFLLYLYFGRTQENLTGFALRDLGILKVKDRQSFAARFENGAEARAGFFYSQALDNADIPALFAKRDNFPPAETEFTHVLREKLLYHIGQYYEKRKEPDSAIAAYALAVGYSSRERLIRLLQAQGQTEQVKALLEAMIANPENDEELLFASDFYERKFGRKKVGVFTEMLRQSESITVDEAFRGAAEDAALHLFKRQGWAGYHTENGLWLTLFGLALWEVLFEHPDSLHSGFDRLPQSLRDRTFHKKFAVQVDQALQAFREGRGWQRVAKTLAANWGTENPLVYWHEDMGQMLKQFLDAAPQNAVASILEKMAQDFPSMRDGFPDLMLIGAEGLRFVEIKAEGDQLRRNQLVRLMQLRQAGFSADICRVDYRVDPDQIYVVVDVETTGGRAGTDRVTEIGAVKLRGGEIIDEWQSLINPDRAIPAYITQLTGITNAMVRNAPRFSEIADSFAEFLEGAVFAAHNVNFDYGFITAEFRRVDKAFRLPKICTCASMRRLY
ncbi:MAG: DNA polymerase III subunit epsilon, partial [Alphaproteobacteria bacterium]|nr:DNA polymerase III subunit epsilon [Alphaproteobacteria bacterium]